MGICIWKVLLSPKILSHNLIILGNSEGKKSMGRERGLPGFDNEGFLVLHLENRLCFVPLILWCSRFIFYNRDTFWEYVYKFISSCIISLF